MTLEWLKSDASLTARIAAGVLIFTCLAVVDVLRRGRAATRWREYLFLLAIVAIALLYGIVNDQITSRISWEYFFFGKGLAEVLGPQVPPDPRQLSWEAAKVGMKATWTAGLLIGVAILFANNPSPTRAPLRYPRLLLAACRVILVAAACAAALGYAGSSGWLAAFSDDFRQMLRHDEMRPRRFMIAFGIHLGGYIGGLLGAAWAVITIRRERRFRND